MHCWDWCQFWGQNEHFAVEHFSTVHHVASLLLKYSLHYLFNSLPWIRPSLSQSSRCSAVYKKKLLIAFLHAKQTETGTFYGAGGRDATKLEITSELLALIMHGGYRGDPRSSRVDPRVNDIQLLFIVCLHSEQGSSSAANNVRVPASNLGSN